MVRVDEQQPDRHCRKVATATGLHDPWTIPGGLLQNLKSSPDLCQGAFLSSARVSKPPRLLWMDTMNSCHGVDCKYRIKLNRSLIPRDFERLFLTIILVL